MNVHRYARIRTEGKVFWAQQLVEELTLLDGPPWAHPHATGQRCSLEDVELLVPAEPTKIVAVGQNYKKHAAEMGKSVPEEPLLFIKPPSALNATGRSILLPSASREVHHEAELALVIGKTLHRVSEAEAHAGIFGLTCFNDVTARDIQRREVQHTRAKSYDTFACAGPVLVTGLSPADLAVTCRVNGEVRQSGRTSDMVFSPAKLVSFISHIMTLVPGDLVSTGTPSGVGPLRAGDRVEVEIEHLGTLVNLVQAEPTP